MAVEQQWRPRITVVGLGYVGLPLAVVLARHFDTIGLDINERRVAELRGGFDRTDEVSSADLRASSLVLSTSMAECAGSDVYIVTVPTPVTEDNRPDLGPVMSATRAVATVLTKGCGAIIVYESTVYPGVTEEICGPELEKLTGLKQGVDFYLGYSPERINPGDREHTVDRITKVISGENPDVVEKLAILYGAVTTGGVFRATSIKAAEAAKVIENAQRDINIAFMNEISMIFQKMGLSAYDVLDAAGTKWNFLPFSPGLVGGHCIGVDPYYLAHRAMDLGHDPQVILAGRRINDGMGQFVADQVHGLLGKPGRVLMLGLTFKENVPDLRNSKVIDVIRGLQAHGHDVTIHDVLADPHEAKEEYGVEIVRRLADLRLKGQAAPNERRQSAQSAAYDAVVGAVPHTRYAKLTAHDLTNLVASNGVVADIKGMWRKVELPASIKRWQL